MHRPSALAVGLLLAPLLLGSRAATHQDPVDRTYRGAIDAAQRVVGDWMSRQGIPGLAIAVSVDRSIVWSEGFGVADLENHVPVSTHTRFRIGSVSKLLTAAAAARLHQQGLLDLDAAVQRYVPAFPEKAQPITSRELLGHLAGVRHYRRDEYINRQHYERVAESLKIFEADPLLHAPNSKYLYSSYGYVLLGAVIEGAAKDEYLHHMQTEVFEVLGLKDTVADDSLAIVERRTRFYARSAAGTISNDTFVDTSDKLPAGGFLSSAEDLATFGAASVQGDFFAPGTRALLFTSQKTLDGTETHVGLGWRIGADGKGRRIYHHGGDAVGGRAFVLAYPTANVVVAIACNLTFAKIADVEAAAIADLFMR